VKEMREAKWEGKVYFPTFVIRNKGIHWSSMFIMNANEQPSVCFKCWYTFMCGTHLVHCKCLCPICIKYLRVNRDDNEMCQSGRVFGICRGVMTNLYQISSSNTNYTTNLDWGTFESNCKFYFCNSDLYIRSLLLQRICLRYS
jgi:hypothetical protein